MDIVKKATIIISLSALLMGGYMVSLPKSVIAFSSVLGIRDIGFDELRIDGSKIEDSNKPVNAGSDQPTFSGYTLPGIKVILFIHSTTIKRETLSDANGYWIYKLDTKLEKGQHTLSMQLIDEERFSSKEEHVATFNVPAEKSLIGATRKVLPNEITTLQPNYLNVTLVTLGAILAISLLYLLLHKRLSKRTYYQ